MEMEAIHTHLHLIQPLAPETLDTTNKRIRRVLNAVVLYDEQEIAPEELAASIIGTQYIVTFPGEEERRYRWDDVVFIAAHKVRLHLSRPMTA